MPATGDNLMEKVGDVLREVATVAIEPRFEALRDGDVRVKSPGEIVTVADIEAEHEMKARLGELIPDAVFVGEEEFVDDAGLGEALRGEQVWLVDPLDGTANFVAGSPLWAVMVALVKGGSTTAAWLWQPTTRVMYQAESGAGATRNCVPLVRQPAPSVAADLCGAVLTRFLDASTSERVDANRGRFASVGSGTRSAGIDYPMLVEGAQDFVMFWRTLPWDHAPGALLVEESGGCVRRLDGDPYSPSRGGAGLLAAADPAAWRLVRETLLGDLRFDGDGEREP